MAGKQLLASGDLYSREKIGAFPEDFQDEIAVSNLQKIGLLDEDKRVKKRKAEHLASKMAKRKVAPTTDEQFEDSAKSAIVDNDRDWKDEATVERIRDLEMLASKAFWDKLKVNNAVVTYRFKSVLKSVLPDFWDPSMESRSKASIMPELKAYLSQLEAKAKAAQPGACQGTLEEVVKVDNTTYLSNERAALQSFQKHGESLFELCGVEIGEAFRGFGGILDEDWEVEAEECDSESEVEHECEYEYEEED